MSARSLATRVLPLIALAALFVTAGGPGRAAVVRAQGAPNIVVPPAAFDDLKWRLVGATRGGRATAYSGVDSSRRPSTGRHRRRHVEDG